MEEKEQDEEEEEEVRFVCIQCQTPAEVMTHKYYSTVLGTGITRYLTAQSKRNTVRRRKEEEVEEVSSVYTECQKPTEFMT